jgi:ABC-2 type transport system ATP-binding protein
VSLLRVDGVSKHFGALVAVDDATMHVDTGEVVGLIGANGAGKTTLIRMILGLLSPTSGAIRVLEDRPGDVDRSKVGYVPQGLGLYTDLTVAENLDFSAGAFSVPKVDFDPDLARVSDRQVKRISLGLQRRLAFAAMLGHAPELLVLDEPTSGVGPVGRAGLWEQIRSEVEAGSGVLVSTHYMEEAEQCDRVLMMAGGRIIAAGTIDEIIAGRTTSYVTGVDPAEMSVSDLIAIPDGIGWRVPGVRPDELRALFGDAIVEPRPMNFEEAFIGMA